MAYYENASQYIKEFNLNAPIVDTEERDNMCKMWEELAYSKIYLMSLCYDETDQIYYWCKEPVYWTGWEWNEENNHIHGIGTMRNVNNMDEQQKSHIVFDLSFSFIISEKRLEEMYRELKTDTIENLRKKYDNLNDDGIENFGNYIGDLRKTYVQYGEDFMNCLYQLNKGKIPGKLDIHFPRIDDL
tara:strand:+ start:452 stop:1009 length:558 start_codon:yes stop_codon:yes gene_type:complete